MPTRNVIASRTIRVVVADQNKKVIDASPVFCAMRTINSMTSTRMTVNRNHDMRTPPYADSEHQYTASDWRRLYAASARRIRTLLSRAVASIGSPCCSRIWL